jgi:hypothetical protein
VTFVENLMQVTLATKVGIYSGELVPLYTGPDMTSLCLDQRSNIAAKLHEF